MISTRKGILDLIFRFIKPKEEQNKKRDFLIQEKKIREEEKEQEIINSCKRVVMPKSKVDKVVKRMYEESERRKLVTDDKNKMRRNHSSNQISDNGISQDQEFSPSRFKNARKSQKYNFQSDSESENEQNFVNKLRENSSNKEAVFDRLYQPNKKAHIKLPVSSNTDINNKRFAKSGGLLNQQPINNIIIEEKEVSQNSYIRNETKSKNTFSF